MLYRTNFKIEIIFKVINHHVPQINKIKFNDKIVFRIYNSERIFLN